MLTYKLRTYREMDAGTYVCAYASRTLHTLTYDVHTVKIELELEKFEQNIEQRTHKLEYWKLKERKESDGGEGG